MRSELQASAVGVPRVLKLARFMIVGVNLINQIRTLGQCATHGRGVAQEVAPPPSSPTADAGTEHLAKQGGAAGRLVLPSSLSFLPPCVECLTVRSAGSSASLSLSSASFLCRRRCRHRGPCQAGFAKRSLWLLCARVGQEDDSAP